MRINLNSTRIRMVLVAVVLGGGLVAHGTIASLAAPLRSSAPTWSEITIPVSSASFHAQLASVSCPAAGNCQAVGWIDNAHLQVTERNGTSVSSGTPAPDGAQGGELLKVACWAVERCVAMRDRAGLFYLDMESNGVWKTEAAPLPSNAGGNNGTTSLQNVACQRNGTCTALGSYNDPSNGQLSEAALTNSGGSWRAAQMPTPKGTGATWGGGPEAGFTQETCPSRGSCTAIGAETYFSANPVVLRTPILTATGVGSRWTDSQGPRPAGAPPASDPTFTGLSCPAATACVSSGYYYVSGQTHDIVAVEDHGKWSIKSVPLPAASKPTTASLQSTSCAAVARCEVSGFYNDSAGSQRGRVDIQSRSSWSVVVPPAPPDAAQEPNNPISEIDCVRAGSCFGSGTYTDSGGNPQLATYTQNGSHWTASRIPLPAAASGGGPNSLVLSGWTCSAAGACAAVGYYNVSANVTRPFMAVSDGG